MGRWEANGFQDALPGFRDSGVAVYGVSLDDVETHADLAEEEGVERPGAFQLVSAPPAVRALLSEHYHHLRAGN